MEQLANELSKYGPNDIFFKCAVEMAIGASTEHPWDFTTDVSPFGSIVWKYFTYNYLFKDDHILPSNIYTVTCRCPNCKHTKVFSSQNLSPDACEECSSCFVHGTPNCDSLTCTDVDAFSEAMNLKFVNSPALKSGIVKTFSGMQDIVGPYIGFRYDMGIVVAKIGSRAELAERGWIGEDGLLEPDKKVKILDFAGDLVTLSISAMLGDGSCTRFVVADSIFYFVSCHVIDRHYALFKSKCTQPQENGD